jgi:UDP-hydrolysing UDP-N-acetyl-D-glucosamine 2-epimerase
MTEKRHICVVTTTRAEYGLLYWLMKEIDDDPDLRLSVIAGGAHLSPEFDLTVNEIKSDQFELAAEIEFLLSSDTGVGMGKSMGLATSSFVEAFARIKPDIVVLLGDRYELLSIASAAMSVSIPIAHIHGGEVTEGAVDDSVRHAVTKLSHIHFPVCDRYLKRVLQLGENPKHVFNFGAPGLDHLVRTSFLNRTDIQEALSVELQAVSILCTYHPVTTQNDSGLYGLEQLLKALDDFPDATVVFTQSNADEGGRMMTAILKKNAQRYPKHRYVFSTLGLKNYMSLAKQVNVVVGNSSSGLIEIPFAKTPTVNIGNRQNGRELASSVINCHEDTDSIHNAITKAISKTCQEAAKTVCSPYGSGDACEKIKNTLKEVDLSHILVKQFVDYRVEDEKNICYS